MQLFHRNINSRELSLISAFSAIGAVTRILLANIALESPVGIYGIVIKIGLTETLTFISGFVFGPIVGFLTGALIIVVSDLYTVTGPGPWTPFIAAIIGLFGVCAGIIRRYVKEPSAMSLGLCAALLTILSEFLQNAWVALFYGMPLIATIGTGFPSLIAAVVNNVILIGLVGPRVIRFLQRPTEKSGPASQELNRSL